MPLTIDGETVSLQNEMGSDDYSSWDTGECFTPNYDLTYLADRATLIKRRVANFFNHQARGPYYVSTNSFIGKDVSQTLSIVVLDPRDRKDFEEFFGTDIQNKRPNALAGNANILVRRAVNGYLHDSSALQDLMPLVAARVVESGGCASEELDTYMKQLWPSPGAPRTMQPPVVQREATP